MTRRSRSASAVWPTFSYTVRRSWWAARLSYALSFPDRLNLNLPPLDLSRGEALTFSPPDLQRCPCLRLAYQSIEIGETMPAVLNAANEVAVSAKPINAA